ncbi:MAG: hypothetical protein QNJ82_06410 [Gammaproteobacteria bacterium]|nr:hypothetical protein [Gammaproteobacteria bacterium]
MVGKESAVNGQSFSNEVYERYCREIDKEDSLIDQRLNWMLAAQALLFGALGVSGPGSLSPLHWVIPLVGIGVSYLVSASVKGAVDSLQHFREELERACPHDADKEHRFPQLHRDPATLSRGLVSPKALPWLFFGAWLLFLAWQLAGVLV